MELVESSDGSLPTFSVKDVGFFEGAEKLLEMWFEFPSAEIGGASGLGGGPSGLGLREIQRYYVDLRIFFLQIWSGMYL